MERSSGEKIAIVCPGGGMRCAYSAGVLYALKDILPEPDIAIFSSGSAGGGIYFITKQYEEIKKVWTDLIATPQFISFLRRKVMDIDYLVDVIIKKYVPLHEEALTHSKTLYLVTATDVETGETRYFSQKDAVDPHEILRATKAVPIIFDKEVPILGRRYIDGDFGSHPNDLIKKAIEHGATKVVVVLSHIEKQNFISELVLRFFSLFHGSGWKQMVFKEYHPSQISIPEHVKLVCVSPSKKLPAGVLTINRKKLRKTFELGMRDIQHHKEL